jgi:hypothetical protein
MILEPIVANLCSRLRLAAIPAQSESLDSTGVKPVGTEAKYCDEAAPVACQAREPPAQGRRRICMAAQR